MELFVSDITGNYFSYYANAIGENDDKIKETLREKYRKDMKINEGVKIALDIFKEMKGEKFDINKFEIAYLLKDDSKIKRKDGDEIKNL
jgi:20S proteasome alpha/beta subunit